jgi:PKD repeat protein
VPVPTPTAAPSQAPLGVIIAPTQGQVGQVISFNGSQSQAASAITSYAWSFGDGAVAYGPLVTHTYAVSSTYQVSLTVTDQQGLSDVELAFIAVTTAPAGQGPVAIINGPTKASPGQTVSFDGSSTLAKSPIVSYTWNFGDGLVGDGVVPTHTYSLPGLYSVTLTVVDQQQMANTTVSAIRVVGSEARQASIERPYSPAFTHSEPSLLCRSCTTFPARSP